MAYQVTARKWRPLIFDDVIGQSHVSNTLRNALATNRVAHAFIFSGTRGCGKTTMARILARAVNCPTPKNFDPCNECELCREIIDGRSMDVIEIDGASNRGVDEIRNLRESVRYAPAHGKKKIYIIDEVHMLTKEAFNALLKTLEEPPAHALFIFATTEIHKVPATILSRCQRYDFRRISVDEIVGRLRYIASQENITIDDDSLIIIAKKGDGSMRDAQSIFDQVVSFCGTTIAAGQVKEALNIVDQELFFKFSDAIKAHDTAAGLALVEEVIDSGHDVKEFISELAEHFRNFLIAETTGNTQMIETSEVFRKRYAADAAGFTLHDILRIIKVLTELESSIRFSPQPRFKLEVAIVQLTKMETSVHIEELLRQIDELKKKLNSSSSNPSASLSAQHAAVHTDRSITVPVQKEHPSPYSITLESTPAQQKSITQTIPMVTESDPPPARQEFSFILVQQQWEGIVDEVRKRKISVGTMLGAALPHEIENGTLRIACTDEFHRSTLFRNKDFLTETINTILRSKLRIEPFLQTSSTAAIPKQENSPSALPNSAKDKAQPQDEHPLIQTLFRDFGAERL